MNSENDSGGCCEEKNDMYFMEETHTKIDFSLMKEPAENVTIKRELDDFDNRKIANEVDQDGDQKSTIKIHSHIKNEEENLKITNELVQDLDQKSILKSEEENDQYLISHEEVNIKAEDDEEQLDNGHKNHESKDQIKIHKCPDCIYQSKFISHLKRHSIRHRKPDEIVWYRCTECPYKTEWKNNIKQHAVVHNDTKEFETFKCAHCAFETSWKQYLKLHLLVHRGENTSRIHCPEPHCSYTTHNKIYLKSHLVVHSNDYFFKCIQCTFQTKRQQDLKRHQLTHERTDKWPSKAINVNNHVRARANPAESEWYMCEQCPYKTYRKDNFKRHLVTHNMDQAKTLRTSYLRQHLQIHQDDDGPGWHRCPECPYKAKFKSHLLRHAKNHKSADQTNWLQCPECSYRTYQMRNLEVHRRLHSSAALSSDSAVKNELEALSNVSCENAPT